MLTAEDLNALGSFARYRDVDGDAIGWRTLPGTPHPKAAYFTRGSGHNDAAGYTEKPDEYLEVMDRLTRKFENARKARSRAGRSQERHLEDRLHRLWQLRLRASAKAWTRSRRNTSSTSTTCASAPIPFAHEIHDFVASHERVYVVEQDRDAQLASLLKLDLPAEQVVKLRSILHYNGLPIDARSITEEFATKEGL